MDAPVRPLSARGRFVLRAALVIAWASGVGGAAMSCAKLKHYSGPVPARVASKPAPALSVSASASAPASAAASVVASSSASVEVAPTASAPAIAPLPSASSSASNAATPAVAKRLPSSTEAQAELMSEVLERYRSTRLPLTAANLLLSLALVIGAARTLARRAGGKSWLRQVCVATVVFALVEHVVSRDERAYLAERLAPMQLARVSSPQVSREEQERMLRTSTQAMYGFLLALQIGLFGGLAYALGRPSVILELAPRDPARRSLPPSSTDDGEL